jgi:hypothetical protein
MSPKNMKPSAIGTLLCLLMLLFLIETTAFGGTETQSSPQKTFSNTVTAPIPSKPGVSITGPSISPSGKTISPKTAALNPNGPPSTCPIDLSTGPKGDIRDIRGPIHIPDPRRWVFYALGGLLLLFLAWAIWKWLRKQKSLRSKTAYEIALAELEKAKALMNPELAEGFSVMVSKTIRTYIEKSFGMKVTRKTTPEFITQVAKEPLSELNRYREPLRDFLDHCDLAKFARHTFSQDQMEQMNKSACRFVEETKPQPEAKETDKATSTVHESTSAETPKESIHGKSGFFKGRLRDGFTLFPKKISGPNGFNSTHQAVTAGGR